MTQKKQWSSIFHLLLKVWSSIFWKLWSSNVIRVSIENNLLFYLSFRSCLITILCGGLFVASLYWCLVKIQSKKNISMSSSGCPSSKGILKVANYWRLLMLVNVGPSLYWKEKMAIQKKLICNSSLGIIEEAETI